jgi:hypothetical protein
MAQGKLDTIGRGSIKRKHPESLVAGNFVHPQRTAHRKGMGNPALLHFRGKHKNLTQLGERACEGV